MTDIINLTGKEFDKLLDKVYAMTTTEYDLYDFNEVPLPKVTVILTGSNGRTSTFYYEYLEKSNSLLVDVEHKFKIQYFYHKPESNDKIEVAYDVIGAVPKNWLDTLNSLDKYNPRVSGWRAVHLSYWNLEYMLRHLPELYVVSQERKVCKKGKGNHSRHVVKLVNRYRINNDVLNEPKGSIVFTCPAWGVRGHYRLNPKTGKRDIYVKAYVKGKERHNPEKYVAKEYQL